MRPSDGEGVTRSRDGLQRASVRNSSGQRGSNVEGGGPHAARARTSGAGAPERQGTDQARNSLVYAGLTGFFFKNLN
jgi:hypothetical protein